MRTLAILTLIALAAPHAVDLSAQSTQSWTQWGGPTRNFIVNSTGLAEKWPETGPPVMWSRPLGTGHSAILVDDGRLFTMYRAGNGRAKQGPWESEETVVAMDGSISGEHGIGLAKTPFLRIQHSPAQVGAMQAVKRALDPNDILNPGKTVPRP